MREIVHRLSVFEIAYTTVYETINLDFPGGAFFWEVI